MVTPCDLHHNIENCSQTYIKNSVVVSEKRETPERKILQWAADEAFKNTKAAEQHVSSLLASVNELARLLELASYTVEPGSPGKKPITPSMNCGRTYARFTRTYLASELASPYLRVGGGQELDLLRTAWSIWDFKHPTRPYTSG